MPDLVLASASPRRADLLRAVGVSFETAPAEIDETPGPAEDALDYVDRMASEKCRAARLRLAGDDPTVVLAADTVVVLDGVVLGKPVDAADATRMLGRLSGRTHQVYSSVCVADAARTRLVRVKTDVTFAELTAGEIEWYVATGDPLDKAGAYGVQTAGGSFVLSVAGSPSNVVGLPLRETLVLLREAGVVDRP